MIRDFFELFTELSLDRRSADGFPGVCAVLVKVRGYLKISNNSGTLGIDEGLAVLLFLEGDLDISYRPVSIRDLTPVRISDGFRADMGGFRCFDRFRSPPDLEL